MAQDNIRKHDMAQSTAIVEYFLYRSVGNEKTRKFIAGLISDGMEDPLSTFCSMLKAALKHSEALNDFVLGVLAGVFLAGAADGSVGEKTLAGLLAHLQAAEETGKVTDFLAERAKRKPVQ